MYLPPQFKSSERDHARALMRDHAFASLISNDDDGLPFITHLPLHLDERGDEWVLLGHLAKPNPHWRYLHARPKAVVTFLGPHAYLSPKVYPDLARVPSWNYLALHCTVEASLVDDAQAKDDLLKKLIADYEPSYTAQWQGLDPDFVRKMLGGIVGFELRVTDWQCKLKLNQHRPEASVALRDLYLRGNEDERALADWMDRLSG